MNLVTKQIMERFGLGVEEALEVQWAVDAWVTIDYSEATRRELNQAYDIAYALWKEDKVSA
jgi:hypothetical protein